MKETWRGTADPQKIRTHVNHVYDGNTCVGADVNVWVPVVVSEPRTQSGRVVALGLTPDEAVELATHLLVWARKAKNSTP